MSLKPPVTSRPSSASMKSVRYASSPPSPAAEQTTGRKAIQSSCDARQLLPKAKELGNKIHEDEVQSRRLVRGLYSAEQAASQPSFKENLVQYYLKTKFDSMVIQDLCKRLFGSAHEKSLKPDIQFDFSVDIEKLMGAEPTAQINNIIKLAESFKSLIFELSAKLLEECGFEVEEDLGLPPLCSPKLENTVSLASSYIEVNKALKRVEVSETDRQTDNLIENLRNRIDVTEKELSSVSAAHAALKLRYDGLFSEGSRHQSAVRQQSTIDALEMQVRDLNKQIEDVYIERRQFMQSEALMRDSLLQATTQLNSLRAAYESEVTALRPLVQEQLEQSREDKREMDALRTGINLSAGRFTLSEERIKAVQSELTSIRKEKNDLEKVVADLNHRISELQANCNRQERIGKVTMAAKVHSDDLRKNMEQKLAMKCDELESVKRSLTEKESELDEATRYIEELKCLYESEVRKADDYYHQAMAAQADAAAMELCMNEVKDKLANFESVGLTPEKQEEWDSREKVVQDLQEVLKKTKVQLKTALTRVYEMQQEIECLRQQKPIPVPPSGDD